jgi:hypothetical protein
MFGKLTLDAVPYHEPIIVVTIAAIIIGGAALLGLITYFGKWSYLWNEWLTSVDHKKLGIMYCIVGIVMLIRGFADAIMMRSQQALASAGEAGFLPPHHYDQIFTAHGVIMIFFVAMPLVIGLMNVVVPLQIGARVAGFRQGWMVLNGPKKHAKGYIEGLEMLASMRLCANVPAQHAIQTALGGYQSISEFIAPGGRLYEQRNRAWELINDIPGVSCVKPKGALYMFPKIDIKRFNIFDDQKMVLDFLLQEKVLLVQPHGPGAIIQRFAKGNIQVARNAAVNGRLGHARAGTVIQAFFRMQYDRGLAASRDVKNRHRAVVVRPAQRLYLAKNEMIIMNLYAIARHHAHITFHTVVLAERNTNKRHRQPDMPGYHPPIAKRGFGAARDAQPSFRQRQHADPTGHRQTCRRHRVNFVLHKPRQHYRQYQRANKRK